MALPYSTDGGYLPFGTMTVTITTIVYVIESFDVPVEAARKIERRDENGDPADFMLREDFRAGSMTLQMDSTSTDLPLAGAEFTLAWNQDVSAETYVVGAVTVNRDQGEGFHTCTCEVHKKVT